jgi:hypothetical protein
VVTTFLAGGAYQLILFLLSWYHSSIGMLMLIPDGIPAGCFKVAYDILIVNVLLVMDPAALFLRSIL